MKSFKVYISERSNPDLSGIPVIKKGLQQAEQELTQELLPKDFAKKVKEIAKKGYKYITVQVVEHMNALEDEFAIKGEYDDQLFGKPGIWINLILKDSSKPIKLSSKIYNRFIEGFLDIIEHELTHQAQSAKRDYEPVDVGSKVYYNQTDEVDAYARDIAKELRRNYTSKHRIPFNNPETIRSKTLKYILDNMDKYNIEKNRKRLLKRVVQYLEVI